MPSGFTQRVITAIFFAIAMIGGIYTHEITFVALFGIISSLCVWEFLTITLDNTDEKFALRRLLGVSISFLIYFWAGTGLYSSTIPLLLVPIFGIFVFELFSKSAQPFQNIGFLLGALVYITLPFVLLCLTSRLQGALAQLPNDFQPHLAMGLLLLTWANDTFAYLVGSQIGKTPLLPRISPKKTWEGTIGGVVMTMATGFIFYKIVGILPLKDWLVLAAIIGIFGTMGDLIESMLKRSFGIKDSGTFLPGHGGFLDRFDAFIFHLPFCAAYLWMR
jgi:phosphatidate cytidylyltransferase